MNYLPVGEKNGKSKNDIASPIGCENTKVVAKEIRKFRENGTAIFSVKDGFFLPSSAEEAQHFIGRTYRRMMDDKIACLAAERWIRTTEQEEVQHER